MTPILIGPWAKPAGAPSRPTPSTVRATRSVVSQRFRIEKTSMGRDDSRGGILRAVRAGHDHPRAPAVAPGAWLRPARRAVVGGGAPWCAALPRPRGRLLLSAIPRHAATR